MKSTYMTLRELKGQLPTTRGVPTPSPHRLLEGGGILEKFKTDDFQITVFRNGFALAQSGTQKTVIQVDECGDYTYDFEDSWLEGEEDATPHCLGADYFLDLPWPIRLLMEAGDRFETLP